MTLQRWLIVYLAYPVLLAVFNGVRGTVWAPEMGATDTILMFLFCGLLTYWFAALVAHSLHHAMATWSIHPVFALISGIIAALFFSYFVILVYINAVADIYPSLAKLINADGSVLTDGLIDYVTRPSTLIPVPLWLGANYVYEAISKDVLFFPSLREKSEPASSQKAPNLTTSPFFTKLKRELGQNILALEAQEHYVRVYTDKGDSLVLYRFGDAVQEVALSFNGLRVHRSYWIAKAAVSEIYPAKSSYRLKLSNDLEVPVSNAYKKVVEEHLVSGSKV
ncbi:MAG: LytTR family DNA-binding domain-containing protein [Rhodospirillaceae bacterium]|nr:LytTR family DNA-binding domain-containing protein [Rhodospirillaceae bacterium]